MQRHTLLEAAHRDDFCALSGKLNPDKCTFLLRDYKGKYIWEEKISNNVLARGLVYIAHKELSKFNHSARKCLKKINKKTKWRDGSPKRNVQVTNKYTKDSQHGLGIYVSGRVLA